MRLAQDLVQDDPEGPHVDLGVVAAGDLVLVVDDAVHFGGDVRLVSDLCAEAAAFGHPFGVVEIAYLDPDGQRGGD